MSFDKHYFNSAEIWRMLFVWLVWPYYVVHFIPSQYFTSCKLTVVGNLSARFLNMNLATRPRAEGRVEPHSQTMKERELHFDSDTFSEGSSVCILTTGKEQNRTSLGFLNNRRAKWKHAGIFFYYSSCWTWFILAQEYHGCKYIYSLNDMQCWTMEWIKW